MHSTGLDFQISKEYRIRAYVEDESLRKGPRLTTIVISLVLSPEKVCLLMESTTLSKIHDKSSFPRSLVASGSVCRGGAASDH